jgi:5'/3'-nucleotidase SurE
MPKKPLILVTNDDGIHAPGITYLAKIASQFGKVVVVAPDKPQSGMGHAITINAMLRIQKTKYHNVAEEYACSGTPVDCVKMAINHILKQKPDLILMDINLIGPNTNERAHTLPCVYGPLLSPIRHKISANSRIRHRCESNPGSTIVDVNVKTVKPSKFS